MPGMQHPCTLQSGAPGQASFMLSLQLDAMSCKAVMTANLDFDHVNLMHVATIAPYACDPCFSALSC